MKTRLLLIAACWAFANGLPVLAADWPQYRGPERNAVSKETGLLKAWPEKGPDLAWTFSKAGMGYSGPAIVGDRLYLMGTREDSEFLFALDAKTGAELWAAKIGPIFTWKGNVWNAGPSATPTVDGERIFALGGQGDLLCTDTAGKEIWRTSMVTKLGGGVNPIGGGEEKLGWGYTWSPLVDGEQLICVPGGKNGTLAALDKKTGAVLWQTKEITDLASYSSPVLAEIGGVKQYVQLTNAGIVAVSTKGETVWTYKRKPVYSDVVISTPIVEGDQVFVSVGFSLGCDLVKLTGTGKALAAVKVYANKSMQNRDGGMVLVEGSIFGYSEGKGWMCQTLKDGKSIWTSKKLGRGSIIYADQRLYCYGEDEGAIVLIEASAKGWKEQGRFEIPQKSTLRKSSGKIWTHPVIADGKLYLRDQDLLFCFDLKAKK